MRSAMTSIKILGGPPPLSAFKAAAKASLIATIVSGSNALAPMNGRIGMAPLPFFFRRERKPLSATDAYRVVAGDGKALRSNVRRGQLIPGNGSDSPSAPG